jgi:hypothetical protein
MGEGTRDSMEMPHPDCVFLVKHGASRAACVNALYPACDVAVVIDDGELWDYYCTRGGLMPSISF